MSRRLEQEEETRPLTSCTHRERQNGRCVDCGVEIAEHSWRSASLIARAAEPPEPPTIGGLLYPAKRTLLSGETESMKTWCALVLAKAEMDAGWPVAWADLDAMGPGELLARLRALGVADEVVDELFLYYEPAERLADERLADVCQEVAERGVRLFVIDSFNPMLSLHGLDPGSTADVEAFWREVADPITRGGACPALIDHVVKNAENRGKYAYGSERKASGAIVHLGFRLTEPLTRGGTGRALLLAHKDRPGFLPRPVVGRLVLVSDGSSITYGLEEDRSRAGDKFRPTVLMQRVSERLEGETERRSQRWLREHVTGKGAAIGAALERLVEEGFVDFEAGQGYLSLRPYREADDDFEELVEGVSPACPRRVPELRSTPMRGVSPCVPIGTRDTLAVDLGPGRVPSGSLAAQTPTPPVAADRAVNSGVAPAPGDAGYEGYIRRRYAEGHVTERERDARLALHRGLRALGKAREARLRPSAAEVAQLGFALSLARTA